MLRVPSTSPYPHRLPHRRCGEAGDADHETDRVRTMLRSRDEGEPPKPQERQEFNKQKTNSKARTASPDEQLEGGRVDEDGAADRRAAEEHPADSRTADREADERGPGDQEPVVNLDPVKARLPGHCVR